MKGKHMKKLGILFLLFFLFPSSLLKSEFDPAEANFDELMKKIRKLGAREMQATSEEEKKAIQWQYKVLKSILGLKQNGIPLDGSLEEKYREAKATRESFKKKLSSPRIKENPFLKALREGTDQVILHPLADDELDQCKSNKKKYSSIDALTKLYERKISFIYLACKLARHLDYFKKNRCGAQFVLKQQHDINRLINQIEEINKNIGLEKEKLIQDKPYKTDGCTVTCSESLINQIEGINEKN